MTIKLVRVEAPKFTGGFESNGRVIRTTPQLKFLLGMPDAKARAIMARNRWRATILQHDDFLLRQRITESEPIEHNPDPYGEAAHREERGEYEIFMPPPCHCGAAGTFGYGVRLLKDEIGTWYCFEHWPDRPKVEAAA